jgi:acetyl esterase/lipase
MALPGEILPGLLGGGPQERPEECRLASPVTHVGPHCPPTLLLQGENDYCGIRPDVGWFGRALRAADVPSVFVELTEADHSFPVITAGALRWAPGIQAALYDIERFLALMV